MLNRIYAPILDAIYPPKCGLCDSLGAQAICDLCFANFELSTDVAEHGNSADPLDFHAIGYLYRGRAAQAVRRLKLSHITTLARPLARLTRQRMDEIDLLLEVDWIVPVPMHWRRLAHRGFNQSELLCSELPRNRVVEALVARTRYTKPQMGLSLEQRLKNLDGAFACTKPLQGTRVLLVDDVYTSGTTMRECARTLKAAGAARVGGFALTGGNI